MIRVLRAGMLTTVQDLGRPGFQRLGVVAGGAADPFAARVANALVGNDANAALLEMVFTGPQLCFDSDSLIAWCGADFAPTLDGKPLPGHRPVRVNAGNIVDFSNARRGAMAWVAVAGGLAVPEIMGSRATDLAAAFGGINGRRVMEGDALPVGLPSPWAHRQMKRLRHSGDTAPWSVCIEHLTTPPPHDTLRAVHGPEWDWFSPAAQTTVFADRFQVTKDSNRMGVRLSGPPLALTNPREMISAAVQHGVLQVPPSGQPILLGVDRQTIGGYPRLAAVASVDFAGLAQLRPGDPVRFQEITLAEAHALLLRRERDFAHLLVQLTLPPN